MPSASIVNAATFSARDLSSVCMAKRGWSWFSLKGAMRVGSLHEVLPACIRFTKFVEVGWVPLKK